MKITVSQKEKKLEVIFEKGEIVDKYAIDKSDEFLACVDKLIKKHHTIQISDLKNAKLEFCGVGLLTERVVGVIMSGLYFNFDSLNRAGKPAK